MQKVIVVLLIMGLTFSCKEQEKDAIDLSKATILISSGIHSPMHETLENVLVEEIEKRTGIELVTSNDLSPDTTIALVLQGETDFFGEKVPATEGENGSVIKKEGFHIVHKKYGKRNIVWIVGADTRGVLYGIGKLLRIADMESGQIEIANDIDIVSAPEYPLRGHQFGYRNTANSWDAWTVEQFDQHFREQVLFGANSFENIPFQDASSSVHFKIDPQEMEVRLSEICEKYDADYWVWTPAPHDLNVPNAHQLGLEEQEAFYARCPRLDGVFVPGGDPGDNHPSELIPYLKDLSEVLKKYHPNAGIWVSLQGFNEEKVAYFFDYLKTNNPDWLKGLVYGPSSPPIDLERELLPEHYSHRFYPDITHTVRCHYPVERWDQAFALTLGREPCNPLPLQYAKLFKRDAGYTDGFITYSDGSHDDVNKVVWSQLGWDSQQDVHDIIFEYCHFFFGAEIAEEATTGIFDLEQNWVGPVATNNRISETLALWKKMESQHPELSDNWRWQQLVMRAYYDAYIKERLTYEKGLEIKAYEALADAKTVGVESAMGNAMVYLEKADKEPVGQNLKQKVFDYADALFNAIGAQTSVPKYNASGAERGAILDFIDYPLNNRWWLQDEFEKVRALQTEKEKLERLEFIRTYEFPGKGSFYDNISSADAKHVTSQTDDAIDYLWENNGLSRKRLSTQLFQFSPTLVYDELDANSNYLIRVSGYGEALLRANGERLKPTKYEKGFEEFKEFPLPKNLIHDGKLKITFDKPDEDHLNWRKQSRVTDVWILKQ
ncbi:alpha-glucuronidase family glycosyl hydrolase [Maribacter sp. X9]|uniref:alpha-glucuronidase family glycosyl hydrolase n=1 Tax=Maribacter sp. X9 TaxID=3402159 RepID=UPI003AF3B0AC